MGSDVTPGTNLETGVEPARREASAEEAYAGSLATSETVERVREARSEKGSIPLYLQGLLAEYTVRRRVETA